LFDLRAEPDIDVVGVSYTAQDGIALAATQLPDIIVIDNGLPDLDGATAARQLIDARPDSRVILLTGSGDKYVAFEAARAGCAGFLEKTRTIDELISLIRNINRGQHQPLHDTAEGLPPIEERIVHDQPIVDLQTAGVVGFEALVLWAHPTHGIVQPDNFIPPAEKTTLIVDIGEAVRRAACSQAADWKHHHPTHLASSSE
jgi:DNA-binding NarL/FixJ family response regulator